MRSLFAGCVVLFACASGTKEAAAPAPAATVAAESTPPKSEPPPAPKSTPEPAASTAVGAPPPAGPAQSATQGPMTAAEAAAAVRAQSKGGAGDAPSPVPSEDSCSTDADCVFTRLSPGACCPMLCAPRAVTKAAAEALEAHVKTCSMTQACPQPACRMPPQVTYPACVQNRCVNKVRESKGEQ